MNSATMWSPFSVVNRRPSTYTGALGSSKVPGRLMPRLACFDSPGPLTTHPITASFSSSTPAYFFRHSGTLHAIVAKDGNANFTTTQSIIRDAEQRDSVTQIGN